MFYRLAQCALVFLLIVGCARPAHRKAFDRDLAKIQKVAASGAFEQAADQLCVLVKTTYLQQDKVSLRLRAVDWYLRARAVKKATHLLEELKAQLLDRDSASLVRLRFARIARDHSAEPERSLHFYLKILVEYPETVGARIALKESRTMLWGPTDQEPWLRFLNVALAEVQEKKLSALLRYNKALVLFHQGNDEGATAIIKDLYENHRGVPVWSKVTSLWIRIHRKNKDAVSEAKVLEFLQGYIRPTGVFSSGNSLSRRGEIRLASLYCGELNQPKKGRKLLLNYGKRYPDSSLKDDALWELAQCFTSKEDVAQRERVLCTILREHSGTRFARRARTELGYPLGDRPGGAGSSERFEGACGLDPGLRPGNEKGASTR